MPSYESIALVLASFSLGVIIGYFYSNYSQIKKYLKITKSLSPAKSAPVRRGIILTMALVLYYSIVYIIVTVTYNPMLTFLVPAFTGVICLGISSKAEKLLTSINQYRNEDYKSVLMLLLSIWMANLMTLAVGGVTVKTAYSVDISGGELVINNLTYNIKLKNAMISINSIGSNGLTAEYTLQMLVFLLMSTPGVIVASVGYLLEAIEEAERQYSDSSYRLYNS